MGPRALLPGGWRQTQREDVRTQGDWSHAVANPGTPREARRGGVEWILLPSEGAIGLTPCPGLTASRTEPLSFYCWSHTVCETSL